MGSFRSDWHAYESSRETFGHLHPGIVDNSTTLLAHRFKKKDLSHALIINQVDRKFIACVIEDQLDADVEPPPCLEDDDSSKDGKGHALVLIDQHAADERIRVEYFLKELCLGFLHSRDNHEVSENGVRVRELSPPFPVLLTLHEVQRLAGSLDIQAVFSHWGFRFADLPNTNHHGYEEDLHANNDACPIYTQVFVKGIPEVVGDKVWSVSIRADLTMKSSFTSC
jgi:DNA mismatch repair protein MLH3